MACTCELQPQIGHDETFIPVKIGEPLSTACQRVQVEGSIPQVFQYANFTLVDGALAATKVSNAGIENMSSFFKTRTGCYYNTNARIGGTTCE